MLGPEIAEVPHVPVTSSIAPCAEDAAAPADVPAPPAVPSSAGSTPAGAGSAAAGLAAAAFERRRLVARRVPFAAIPRRAWERLLAVTACATPFSRWQFHRAWWDGYGEGAHEDYMVCLDAAVDASAALDADAIVAIAPLMHRHEVEPDDAVLRTAIRHAPTTAQRTLPDRAKAIFFAASYHADYATLLCDPADLPDAAAAVVAALAAGPDLAHGSDDWDVVDLRRLRADDPALPALEAAFCVAAAHHGWEVTRELEDVCPVLEVDHWDWETYLQTLTTKDRHELRRKMRRAEAAGPVEFEEVPDPADAVDEFVAMHQARWGDDGLFPDTEGGARSRRFFRRLAELEGPDGMLRIGRLRVGGRPVFMCVGFHDQGAVYYYNAGSDPEARALSPGVIGVAWYLRHGLAEGTRVFDFLRGNEGYKYTWGAVDRPIHRLIVTPRAA